MYYASLGAGPDTAEQQCAGVAERYALAKSRCAKGKEGDKYCSEMKRAQPLYDACSRVTVERTQADEAESVALEQQATKARRSGTNWLLVAGGGVLLLLVAGFVLRK